MIESYSVIDWLPVQPDEYLNDITTGLGVSHD